MTAYGARPSRACVVDLHGARASIGVDVLLDADGGAS